MSNYKYTFFDNQLVGVDELNEITSRLVTGGVSAVYSGADFDVSDINNSNYAILCGGIVPESDSNLKITSLGEGKYLINQGLCFFDDGTSMEILSGGEEISVPLGAAKYVYLVSDKNQMKCYVEITDSEKQSGVFQILGFVDELGNITDKRTYARGKVPGFYASVEGKEVNISETYGVGGITAGKDLEIPVGTGNFRHLCIIGNGGIFYCDFENGVSKNQYSRATYQTSDGRFYLFYTVSDSVECDINVKISDGKLIIKPLNGTNDSMVTIDYHLW